MPGRNQEVPSLTKLPVWQRVVDFLTRSHVLTSGTVAFYDNKGRLVTQRKGGELRMSDYLRGFEDALLGIQGVVCKDCLKYVEQALDEIRAKRRKWIQENVLPPVPARKR